MTIILNLRQMLARKLIKMLVYESMLRWLKKILKKTSEMLDIIVWFAQFLNSSPALIVAYTKQLTFTKQQFTHLSINKKKMKGQC